MTVPTAVLTHPVATLRDRRSAARQHRDFERAYLGAEPRVQLEMLAAAARSR